MPSKYSLPNIIRILLILYGAVLLGAALFYYDFIGGLSAAWENSDRSLIQIYPIQFTFALLGSIFLFTAYRLPAMPSLENALSRPWIANALLAAFFTVVPLTVLELVLRQTAEFQLQPRASELFVRDRKLGWRMKPDMEAECGDVTVRTNAHGLRGRFVPYGKPGAAFRILILGDSVTFGHNIERDEDTFPWILRDRLNEGSERRFEVINAGVNGYSTWHQREYLMTEGFRYRPDLVIAAFVLNDVYETERLVRRGKAVHEPFPFVNRSATVFYLRRTLNWMQGKSYTRRAARRQEQLEIRSLVFEPDAKMVRPHWETTIQEFEAMSAFCETHGFQFWIVVLPVATQLETMPDTMTPGAFLKSQLKERQIPVFDFAQPLKVLMENKGIVVDDIFLDEMHFTAIGCQLVADQLQTIVLDRMERSP